MRFARLAALMVVGLLAVLVPPGASARAGDETATADAVRRARDEVRELVSQYAADIRKAYEEGRDEDARALVKTLRRVLVLKRILEQRLADVLAREFADPEKLETPPPDLVEPPGVTGPAGGPGTRWPGPRGGTSWFFAPRLEHRTRPVGGGLTGAEAAVDLGLEWLKLHQDPDGGWDCDGFMDRCRLNQCDGAGYALYDPGITGLAILAFLGVGETHRTGSHRDVVRGGLEYLRGIQDPDGCFGPRTSGHFMYNHGIATLAAAEAYGMTASPLLRSTAQRGVDFIHKCQNPYLAWRYGVRPGDNDTSVSGWMIQALAVARAAGLRVDPCGFDGMKAWLDKVTDPEYGRVGYTARGSAPGRPQDQTARFPTDKSESLTAIGIFSRVLLGEDPIRSQVTREGTDLCLKSLPVWDEQSGGIDMYYWYFGTLAIFQVGGDPWRIWKEAIRTAVLDSQRRAGDGKGSWDPVGPWGRDGGRIYSTALMVLILETPWRYPRFFGSS